MKISLQSSEETQMIKLDYTDVFFFTQYTHIKLCVYSSSPLSTLPLVILEHILFDPYTQRIGQTMNWYIRIISTKFMYKQGFQNYSSVLKYYEKEPREQYMDIKNTIGVRENL